MSDKKIKKTGIKASSTKITKLLTNIVESGKAENLLPKDIYKLHKEFSVFPLKQFRDRLYRVREAIKSNKDGMFYCDLSFNLHVSN